MTLDNFTRRGLLRFGAGALASELASCLWSGCGGRSILQPGPDPFACGKLNDIEHVVILIQEIRSFVLWELWRGTGVLRSGPSVSTVGSCQHDELTRRCTAAVPSRQCPIESSLYSRHHSRLVTSAPELEQRRHGRVRFLAPRDQYQ
jgi:hypothetical protein